MQAADEQAEFEASVSKRVQELSEKEIRIEEQWNSMKDHSGIEAKRKEVAALIVKQHEQENMLKVRVVRCHGTHGMQTI